MHKVKLPNNVISFHNKMKLIKLKKTSMRSDNWFKILQRIDRVLIELTTKIANVIQSNKLTQSLIALAKKLAVTLQRNLSRAQSEVNLPLAKKFSGMVQRRGNVSAEMWVSTIFANFLTVIRVTLLKHLRILSHNLSKGLTV
jgi:hypothetical protein